MQDYKILNNCTPVVYATKQNSSIATIPFKPQIYYKTFDITEFIGEKLATLMGVRTNHYFPVCLDKKKLVKRYNGNNLFVGSFDFMQPNILYKMAESLPFYYSSSLCFDKLLDSCCDDQNRADFIEENLKMFGLDIYMCQFDREGNTLYEFHPNGEIHLAPVFDYEMSLEGDISCDFEYLSDFFCFMTIDDYWNVMDKYPQFRNILCGYLDIDLAEVVKAMAKERGFSLRHIDLDYYKRFDDVSHKRLEKILK